MSSNSGGAGAYWSAALFVALVPAFTIGWESNFNTSFIPSMLAEKVMYRFKSANNKARGMLLLIPSTYITLLLPLYLIYMVGAAQTDAREGLQASLFLLSVLSGACGLGRLFADGWWYRRPKIFAKCLGLSSDGGREKLEGRGARYLPPPVIATITM